MMTRAHMTYTARTADTDLGERIVVARIRVVVAERLTSFVASRNLVHCLV